MKPFKRIAILAGIVSGIVLLWLIPNINKEKQTRYIRTWEDTDAKSVTVSLLDTTRKTAPLPNVAKNYKTEIIESKAKLRDIKASSFSRAMQFEKEISIAKVLDSLEVERQLIKAEIDSVSVVRLDTLSGR